MSSECQLNIFSLNTMRGKDPGDEFRKYLRFRSTELKLFLTFTASSIFHLPPVGRRPDSQGIQFSDPLYDDLVSTTLQLI